MDINLQACTLLAYHNHYFGQNPLVIDVPPFSASILLLNLLAFPRKGATIKSISGGLTVAGAMDLQLRGKGQPLDTRNGCNFEHLISHMDELIAPTHLSLSGARFNVKAIRVRVLDQ